MCCLIRLTAVTNNLPKCPAVPKVCRNDLNIRINGFINKLKGTNIDRVLTSDLYDVLTFKQNIIIYFIILQYVSKHSNG